MPLTSVEKYVCMVFEVHVVCCFCQASAVFVCLGHCVCRLIFQIKLLKSGPHFPITDLAFEISALALEISALAFLNCVLCIPCLVLSSCASEFHFAHFCCLPSALLKDFVLLVVLHISFHLFIRFRAFENFACCFSFCLSDSMLLKTLHVVFHFLSDSVLLKISYTFVNRFLRFTDSGFFPPPAGYPRKLLDDGLLCLATPP